MRDTTVSLGRRRDIVIPVCTASTAARAREPIPARGRVRGFIGICARRLKFRPAAEQPDVARVPAACEACRGARQVIMRIVALTLCLVIGPAFAAPTPAAAQSKFFTFERNTDRPGRDYSNTASAGATECSFACQAENRCRAWTYVKRGIQGPSGRCFLKDPAPPARANNCCTSGLRKGSPVVTD
jgi:hypothetical protein